MNEFTTKSPPPPDDSDASLACFRDVSIDFRRQTIVRDGREVRLRGKSFDVLAYLVRNAGRVVAKQELIDAVWDGVAVSDDSLVQCLVEIRRSLADAQDVVKTVRGRGYMLDAAVAPSPAPAPGPAVSRAEPATSRRWRLWVAALTVSAAVLLGAVSFWSGAGVDDAAVKPGAVMPEATLSGAASDAFAAGNRALGNPTQVSLQTARKSFETAIALDPNYAPAHSALANALCILSAFGIEPPAQVLPPARTAARRAVELEPTHAFGWHALAHSQVQWDRDWTSAEANYRRAIALDPNETRSRFLLAHLLVGVGRTDEAFQELDRALSLEPESPVLLGSKGVVNYLARRPERALAAFDEAIARSPGYSLPQFWRGLVLSSIGRHADAMAAALKAREDMGNAPAWLVGFVHAQAGRRSEAQEVLHALELREQQQYVPPVDLALVHVALGNHEKALDWLEKGLQQHSRWMELLAVLPAVDPLRGDPRFSAILRAMQLPILR